MLGITHGTDRLVFHVSQEHTPTTVCFLVNHVHHQHIPMFLVPVVVYPAQLEHIQVVMEALHAHHACLGPMQRPL